MKLKFKNSSDELLFNYLSNKKEAIDRIWMHLKSFCDENKEKIDKLVVLYPWTFEEVLYKFNYTTVNKLVISEFEEKTGKVTEIYSTNSYHDKKINRFFKHWCIDFSFSNEGTLFIIIDTAETNGKWKGKGI